MKQCHVDFEWAVISQARMILSALSAVATSTCFPRWMRGDDHARLGPCLYDGSARADGTACELANALWWQETAGPRPQSMNSWLWLLTLQRDWAQRWNMTTHAIPVNNIHHHSPTLAPVSRHSLLPSPPPSFISSHTLTAFLTSHSISHFLVSTISLLTILNDYTHTPHDLSPPSPLASDSTRPNL